MPDKIIAIEKFEGPYQNIFEKVIRMVPDRDKNDIKVKRLIAFRLRTDGEAATREYLINYNKENRIFEKDDMPIWELTHLSLSYKSNNFSP